MFSEKPKKERPSSMMSLRKMKSKIFRTDSQQQQATPAYVSQSRPIPNRGPPPPIQPNPTVPKVNPVHIPPPTPRQLQKQAQRPTQEIQEQSKYVTAENIKELRELIRARYALDCEIWEIGRKVKWYQRDPVEAKMVQADATMVAIRSTLQGWDKPEYFESPEAYNRFREIKGRLMSAKARNWTTCPPWDKPELESNNSVHEKDGRSVFSVQHVYTPKDYQM